MGSMRALHAAGLAALSALALATAGCGGSSAFIGGSPRADAAQLVPPTALAFVSSNTDLESSQWQRLDDLTRGLPARQRLEKMLRDTLAQKHLDFEAGARPALGPELNLAVLGGDAADPEVIALVQPDDQAKLRALESSFDEGDEHY